MTGIVGCPQEVAPPSHHGRLLGPASFCNQNPTYVLAFLVSSDLSSHRPSCLGGTMGRRSVVHTTLTTRLLSNMSWGNTLPPRQNAARCLWIKLKSQTRVAGWCYQMRMSTLCPLWRLRFSFTTRWAYGLAASSHTYQHYSIIMVIT